MQNLRIRREEGDYKTWCEKTDVTKQMWKKTYPKNFHICLSKIMF